jgi:putrescine transport system substrate-binding protein
MRQLFAAILMAACSFAHAEQVLKVWNWNDYIAPQVLAAFEKEHGVTIEYTTFSTAEELLAAFADGTPMDVAVPTHNNLPELIKTGKLLPLDFNQLPNRQHLDRNMLNKLAAFDSRNLHSVPYLWGAVGLAVNVPKAEEAFGGPLPNSWSLLFNSEYSDKLAVCGMSMLDSSDDMLTILMNYQGRTFSESSPRQVTRAGDKLLALKPNLRYVDSERYIDDLSSGELCLAVAYVGDALAAADSGQPVEFLIPQEGSTLFIDNLVIPANSTQPELAHKFINYLMQPDVMALITEETLYPSANTAATALLPDELRNQPGISVDNDTKRRLFLLDVIPETVIASRDAVWESLLDDSTADEQ